jgi:hypothetical protein
MPLPSDHGEIVGERERPVAVVAVDAAGEEIAGDQQIGPAIAVDVGEVGREAVEVVARAEGRDAGDKGRVGEDPGAVVAPEMEGRRVGEMKNADTQWVRKRSMSPSRS